MSDPTVEDIFEMVKNVGKIEEKLDTKDSEIDRLRAENRYVLEHMNGDKWMGENRKLREKIEAVRLELAEKNKRIEELEKWRALAIKNGDGILELEETLSDCRGRIEELESAQSLCPWCGSTEDPWFSRTIEDLGFGEQMHNICSDCGKPIVSLHTAQARIEELESEAAVPAIAAVEAALRGHFFTDEQIDKAWDMISFWLDSKQGAVEVLAKLGIVECGDCGGSGNKRTTIDHNAYGKPVRADITCPTCDGHGWRINNG